MTQLPIWHSHSRYVTTSRTTDDRKGQRNLTARLITDAAARTDCGRRSDGAAQESNLPSLGYQTSPVLKPKPSPPGWRPKG